MFGFFKRGPKAKLTPVATLVQTQAEALWDPPAPGKGSRRLRLYPLRMPGHIVTVTWIGAEASMPWQVWIQGKRGDAFCYHCKSLGKATNMAHDIANGVRVIDYDKRMINKVKFKAGTMRGDRKIKASPKVTAQTSG